jgi:hypothetical protein
LARRRRGCGGHQRDLLRPGFSSRARNSLFSMLNSRCAPIPLGGGPGIKPSLFFCFIFNALRMTTNRNFLSTETNARKPRYFKGS